jgi:hypothetical protein
MGTRLRSVRCSQALSIQEPAIEGRGLLYGVPNVEPRGGLERIVRQSLRKGAVFEQLERGACQRGGVFRWNQ